ncbi:hypothetical protein ACC754_39075, partial [Rhizobium johnstonii]
VGGAQFGIAGTANFWVIAVSLEGLLLCPALYWATRHTATQSTIAPSAAAGVSTYGNSLDETDQIEIPEMVNTSHSKKLPFKHVTQFRFGL